jgi:hypothetical protein
MQHLLSSRRKTTEAHIHMVSRDQLQMKGKEILVGLRKAASTFVRVLTRV